MQKSINDMTAHNEALIAEVLRGRRALEQLRVKVGHLQADNNELMVGVGKVSKGAGGTGAVAELPTP